MIIFKYILKYYIKIYENTSLIYNSRKYILEILEGRWYDNCERLNLSIDER